MAVVAVVSAAVVTVVVVVVVVVVKEQLFLLLGGVPGEDFDMENPNLRSKMKSKRPQGGKRKKHLDYKI